MIFKTDYRELEHYLCYAINRDIDGDCPGSICHSARLAQRNFPTKHELERNGLNSEKVLERSVEIFWKFQLFKFSINERVFLRNTKNGHFDQKS